MIWFIWMQYEAKVYQLAVNTIPFIPLLFSLTVNLQSDSFNA
jgi:hypothetical protein